MIFWQQIRSNQLKFSVNWNNLKKQVFFPGKNTQEPTLEAYGRNKTVYFRKKCSNKSRALLKFQKYKNSKTRFLDRDTLYIEIHISFSCPIFTPKKVLFYIFLLRELPYHYKQVGIGKVFCVALHINLIFDLKNFLANIKIEKLTKLITIHYKELE